jgi:hypothetical protein
VLRDIKRYDRALYRRIEYHYTGQPAPDLSKVSAVMFWLADPLREHYPDCYAEAKAIADDARERGIHIVNPPESLSNSIKSVQWSLWAEEDIPTPPQHRFEDHGSLAELLPQVTFPAFIRSDEHHTQANMFLVQGPGDVQNLSRVEDSEQLFPGTITPLVDTREGYREPASDTPWARYYHKKRALVCGEHVTPIHAYFSQEPIVGVHNSELEFYTRAKHDGFRARWAAKKHCAPCIQADIEYCSQEVAHADLMRRAVRALGLEFAAIDYATHADGTPVLWEANPYFVLPAWYQSVLARERRLKQRYRVINQAVRDFMNALPG